MGPERLKAVLDTSVLIAASELPAGLQVSISAVSLAELHFGAIGARDEADRRERVTRLGTIESSFPAPLPLDGRVARIWGQLSAAVSERGGNPRNRAADLAIAATAVAHEAVLITLNPKDLKLIRDLVVVRVPGTET